MAHAPQGQSAAMQDPYHGHFNGHGGASDAPKPARAAALGGMLNYAGAALSVALVVGLGVWGYKLAMRDVTGIPVVRALEGPMREQPVNPGGQSAAHQGLAVNAVQADGQVSETADRLALAPQPDALGDEDSLGAAVARTDIDTTGLGPMEAPAIEQAAMQSATPVPAPSGPASDPVAEALALAEQLTRDAAPLSGATGTAEPEVVAALVPTPAPATNVIPASVPGVHQSPRPAGRPASLDTTQVTQVSASANAAAAAAAIATVKDVAPEKIAAGTRLVQLGAFDSAEVARAEWDKLSGRFEDYMTGKSRVIQQAQSGGKTFYRLRAMGFADLADARRFCSVLMAAKAACIPVVTR
ncbi:SPOR domain-containing protein [Aliiroseovarius marinus]|uniref:SPOR domain-containing protein n=1 Tax=Aliiroseovarius marinus TaxID=2500159 RepID=UPI003D7D3F91